MTANAYQADLPPVPTPPATTAPDAADTTARKTRRRDRKAAQPAGETPAQGQRPARRIPWTLILFTVGLITTVVGAPLAGWGIVQTAHWSFLPPLHADNPGTTPLLVGAALALPGIATALIATYRRAARP